MQLSSSQTSLTTILREHPLFRTLALVLLCLLIGVVAGASVSFGPFWLGFAALIAGLVGLAVLRSTDLALASVFAAILLLPFGALPFKIAITPTFLELALIVLLGVTTLRVLAVPDVDLRLSSLGGAVFAWIGLTLLCTGAGCWRLA
jgi:hypothetical protein